MAYTKQTWKDGADGGTPITADRLNHIEDGIAAIPKGDKGDKGDTGLQGPPGEVKKADLDALAARVKALEDKQAA